MNIAVIGTGSVGSTLGKAWAAAGHTVHFGSRHPESDAVADLVATAGARASAHSPAEAAAAAPVVVLAVPWEGIEDTLDSMGSLDGKILVDCTNPLGDDLSSLTVGHETSGGEKIAALAPGARVVKAFNSTGADNMADPRYDEAPLALFLAGDDADARATVGRLAADLGFEPVDCGDLDAARLLEPLALLWIRLAYARGMGRDFGFALLRRDDPAGD